MLFSKGEEIRGDISDREIISGDTIIVYGLWERINELKASFNFVVATPYDIEKIEHSKTWIAIACFAIAIVLTLFGFPISMAFFSGAIALVITRVSVSRKCISRLNGKLYFYWLV